MQKANITAITLICLCFGGGLHAQNDIGLSVSIVKQDKIVFAEKYDFSPSSTKLPFSKNSIMYSHNRPKALDFDTKHVQFDENKLAPFCKIEHKINKNSKIPAFFRLGNKEYVDELEGKGSHH